MDIDDLKYFDEHFVRKNEYDNLSKDIDEIKSENKKLIWLLVASLAGVLVDLIKGSHG